MKKVKINNRGFLTLLFITLFLTFGITNYSFAKAQKQDVFEEFSDDFKPEEHKVCETCADAEGCQSGEGTTAPLWLSYAFLFLIAAGGAVYLSRKFSWKIAALLLALVALGFIPKKEACTKHSNNTETILLAEANLPQDEEFTPLEQDEEFEPFEQKTNDDEFEAFSEDDEFQELSDDEFSEFAEEVEEAGEKETDSIWANRNFTLSILVLFLTLIAGILVRFKTTRKLKTFMLLGSMIYLGFINGACPCMISSFQNTIMYFMGIEVKPVLMLWFLGLIPLTYFFGKVWCGWVCHLGALQEFIFRPGVLKVLQDRRSQVILKWVRIVTLVILIAQIITTRTNIFIHYDPFKVAFNLFSANILGYVLLVIMLISSALIYRPFCRAFCPVGLILGWVSHIPGASKLSKNETCIDCKKCSTACNQNAIIYENKKSLLDNEDCILCGDCMDTCKFSSLEIKGLAK